MPNLPRKNVDPYRDLGVVRGASEAEIKKAHRALAKRFHPDSAGGDTMRFLAIQEAYLLLADPLRRREWDARHAPGPVRASEPRKPRPRGADGRWTREEGAPSANRQRSSGPRRTRHAEPAHDVDADGPRQATWSGSDRPSGTRSYRWSAENVPWWEDFAPRKGAGGARGAGPANAASKDAGPGDPGPGDAGARDAGAGPGRRAKAGSTHGPASGAGAGGDAGAAPNSTPHQARPATGSSRPGAQPPTPPTAPHGQTGNEFDVYSRSSGAAWSSAARQYFRKASEDLPSRGSFVYRGTQVVTGATARKVAEDLLRQRPGVGPAPRQAFESRDRPGEAASQPGPLPGQPTPEPTPQPSGPPEANPDARSKSQPGVLAMAAVGGIGGLVVTLPVLALGMTVLNPPLQPAFAALLLVLAAVAGALAATIWMRVRE